MQVVSAGAQTKSRVVNPCYKSGVSHASQQVVTNHLLSRIILQYAAVFQPRILPPCPSGEQYNTKQTPFAVLCDDQLLAERDSDGFDAA